MRQTTPSRQRARSRPQRAKLRVGFLLAHNFTLTAFSTFIDVLRLSADEGDRSRRIACDWEVMNPGRKPVRSSCGVEIQPTADLLAPTEFDYIVIVGGLLHGRPPLLQSVEDYLRRAAKAGVHLAGMCTGSFVLCRLGLMEHRKCCVSWYHYRDFIEEFPALVPVADRLFVVDGDRITCSGGAGVADLAAHLVSKHLDQASAQKALNILLINQPRTEDSIQPVPPVASTSDDRHVSKALLAMEQNLHEPLAISAIAVDLGLSVRQLQRLFRARLGTSPQKAYVALRIKHGQWMLKNTRQASAQIAAELGFADAAHFGRAFKKRFAMTPAAYRKSVSDMGGPGSLEGEVRRVFD